MLRLDDDLSCGSCCLRIGKEEWDKLKHIQADLETLTGKAEHSVIRDDDDNSDNDFENGLSNRKKE